MVKPRQRVAVRGVGKPHIIPDGKGWFVCYQPNGGRLVRGYGRGPTPAEAYPSWNEVWRHLGRVGQREPWSSRKARGGLS